MDNQKQKILESIEFYNPEYIIIDEININDIDLILNIIQKGIFVITSLPISDISSLASNKRLMNVLSNYRKTTIENNNITIINNIIEFNFLEILNNSYKIYTNIKI